MEILIKIIISATIVALIFGYLFYVPYWVKETIIDILSEIQLFILWLIDKTLKTINIAVHSLHWVGRVLVIFIFIAATITLADNIAVVLEAEILNHNNVIYKLTKLFENKVTWVASTAVVATTVALGHFKTIDFNYEKHRQETIEKAIEKHEKSRNT